MITIYRNARRTIKNVPDFCGLSSDEKPMDAKNGSTFLEIDTGNIFKFDEEGKNWYEQPQSGGGSGGTTDYTQLENKPSINGITLEGNQTTEELDIIPVVDLGEISDELPIQTTLNAEQIQTMQKNNCIITALYSGVNLCLRKIGSSDTQIVFSGIIYDRSIYLLVNVNGLQGTFNIFNIAKIPSPTGPDDAGKSPVVNPDGTGWLLESGGGTDWGYHDQVTLAEDVASVKITPDKPLKKLLMLVYTQQKYADESEGTKTGDAYQTVRLNGDSKGVFYGLFSSSSFSKFVKSRIELEIIKGNLVGTFEKLPGLASGGYQMTGADAFNDNLFPEYGTINSVTLTPEYKFIAGIGNVGRYVAGSTFEIWGVYA